MGLPDLSFDRYGRLCESGQIGQNTDILYGTDWFVHKGSGTEKVLKKFALDLDKVALKDEDGNLIKDNRGVDYMFADCFWTQRLEGDFPLIEREFIKHCGAKPQEFNDVILYEDSILEREKPSKRLQKRTLRLVYNGAKPGDEYCIKLIIYLYKIYYKGEYRKLKGFKPTGSQAGTFKSNF